MGKLIESGRFIAPHPIAEGKKPDYKDVNGLETKLEDPLERVLADYPQDVRTTLVSAAKDMLPYYKGNGSMCSEVRKVIADNIPIIVESTLTGASCPLKGIEIAEHKYTTIDPSGGIIYMKPEYVENSIDKP